METCNYLRIFPFSLVMVLSMTFSALADVPDVSNIMVTDVTTTSFSVIWASNEASTPDLNVYSDADGASPVSNAVVIPHPVNDSAKATAITEDAVSSGVMKVMVTGLEPNTTYYFQTVTTSTSTSDTKNEPTSGPYASVITESQTVRTYPDGDDILPFSNDIIIEECYLEDGETAADGSLLVATVAGGNYPVTSFVGDGVDSPNALVDLNNVFSRYTFPGENLDLKQGENLTLLNFRGFNDYSIVYRRVPEDLDLAEIKGGEEGLQYGRNMVSFQLNPISTDIDSVFSNIMDEVISAYAVKPEGGWLSFVKGSMINTLTDLTTSDGFYLYLNDSESFQIDGTLEYTPVFLQEGRNFVGFYSSIETLSIVDAFNDIWDDLISIYTNDGTGWKSFVKGSMINTLSQIEPGRSYLIYVLNDCIWEIN